MRKMKRTNTMLYQRYQYRGVERHTLTTSGTSPCPEAVVGLEAQKKKKLPAWRSPCTPSSRPPSSAPTPSLYCTRRGSSARVSTTTHNYANTRANSRERLAACSYQLLLVVAAKSHRPVTSGQSSI